MRRWIAGLYSEPWFFWLLVGFIANQASVKRHLPTLVDHVMNGRLSPKGLITHRFGLEEISDAYHMFSAKLDTIIKPVLVPASAGV